MGNVGAELGQVGPSGSFESIPALGKWLLAGLMIVGRLELSLAAMSPRGMCRLFLFVLLWGELE
jgi:Trk-type K+ transport system membrane component